MYNVQCIIMDYRVKQWRQRSLAVKWRKLFLEWRLKKNHPLVIITVDFFFFFLKYFFFSLSLLSFSLYLSLMGVMVKLLLLKLIRKAPCLDPFPFRLSSTPSPFPSPLPVPRSWIYKSHCK